MPAESLVGRLTDKWCFVLSKFCIIKELDVSLHVKVVTGYVCRLMASCRAKGRKTRKNKYDET